MPDDDGFSPVKKNHVFPPKRVSTVEQHLDPVDE